MARSPFAPFLNGDMRWHDLACSSLSPFINGDSEGHAAARAPLPPFLNDPAHGCGLAKGSLCERGRAFMAPVPAWTGVRSVVGWVRRFRSAGRLIIRESPAVCQEHSCPFRPAAPTPRPSVRPGGLDEYHTLDAPMTTPGPSVDLDAQ